MRNTEAIRSRGQKREKIERWEMRRKTKTERRGMMVVS